MTKTLLQHNFGNVKNNVFNRGFDGENYQKIEISNVVLDFILDSHIDILKDGGR